jgi:uncharacterized membrane protein
MNRLRAGLKGLPPSALNDIMGDCNAHFAEAAAHGRTEAEVAAKLGDPSRLARELRAEAGLKRWEEEHSAAAALGAIVAVLGLATFDLLVLLPVLVAVGTIVLAFLTAAAGVCFAGSLLLIMALFGAIPGFGGSWLQGVLLGLGITAGSASAVAFCLLFVIGTVNLLVRYGRLHIRAAAPMVSSSEKGYVL